MKCLPALFLVVASLGLAACGGGKAAGTASPPAGPGAGQSPPSGHAGGGPSAGATTTTTTKAPAKGTSAPSGAAKGTAGGSSASRSEEGFPRPAPRHERYPHGDRSIQEYGGRAGAGETAAIASVVKRYYSAVAKGDGPGACALLSPGIVRSILATFANSPALKGKSCEAVLPELLKAPTGTARAAFENVEVTGVRVHGSHAFALLHSKEVPSGEIPMVREGGAWKVNALIGSNLPS